MAKVTTPTICPKCDQPVEGDGSCDCDIYTPSFITGLTSESLFWCPVHHSSGIASLGMDCWERYTTQRHDAGGASFQPRNVSPCRIVEATVTWKDKE